MQMFLAAMLVDAFHVALKDAVEILDRVRVCQAAHILALAMAGEVVGGKVLA